ncbi:MAG: methyltransferase domain-containing protein [Candidatus Aminicenantes bacterium]|nr:methyltransferase domain-containing protein [Candidatus Aminicenantes bacterium]
MKKEDLLAARGRAGTWGHLNPDRLELVLAHAGRKVLDVGCATGSYVRFLLDRGYDAYGLDLLPAAEWASGPAGRFREGDVVNLPYPAADFDTVLAFEVLEHVEDTDRAIAELKRVARRTIILSVPNGEEPAVFREAGLTYHHRTDRTHVHLFTADTLAGTLVRHGLRVRRIGRINRVRPELPFFESLNLPRPVRRGLARLVALWPFRKPYYLTLVAVAEKPEP